MSNPHWREEIAGKACFWCGDDAEDVGYIVPLEQGGPDAPCNAVPTCWPCLEMQRGHTVEDFRQLLIAAHGSPNPRAPVRRLARMGFRFYAEIAAGARDTIATADAECILDEPGAYRLPNPDEDEPIPMEPQPPNEGWN